MEFLLPLLTERVKPLISKAIYWQQSKRIVSACILLIFFVKLA